MRQRVFSVGFRACLAAIALLLATAAVAQLPTTITISDPRGEVDELLSQGQQLEQQRRWGEALAHYEDAVRQYPKEVCAATAIRHRAAPLRSRTPLCRPELLRPGRAAVARAGDRPVCPSAVEDRIALRRRSALERNGRSRRPRLCDGFGRAGVRRSERPAAKPAGDRRLSPGIVER